MQALVIFVGLTSKIKDTIYNDLQLDLFANLLNNNIIIKISENNYDILKKELDKFKNPLSFYNRIKDSDILMDIFHWYKGQNGEILVYGGFETSQDAFNTALEVDLGLDIEE